MSESTIFRNTKGTIGILFDQIDRGELGLPELQRPFVWGTTKVYNEPGKLNTDFDLKKWIPSHTTKEGGQVNEQKARKRFQSKSSN